MKATDMQAAVGCAQLKKFPSFVEKRRHNFDRLHKALEAVSDKLVKTEYLNLISMRSLSGNFLKVLRLRKSGECSEQEEEDWTDGAGGSKFCRNFLQRRSAGLILDSF